MVDLHGSALVQIEIGANNEVWVNVDGVCQFRSKGHAQLEIADNRPMGLLLTGKERERFIEYLRNDIKSNEVILDQMRPQDGIHPDLIKRRNAELVASKLVLKMLESTHS